MSGTVAIYPQGGDWFVSVANTAIRWQFKSAASTRIFARGMSQGSGILAEWIGDGSILVLETGSSAPAPSTIVQMLFKPTSRLTYATEEVFASMEGSTLLEDIIRAGELLLEFAPKFMRPYPIIQPKKNVNITDVQKVLKIEADQPDFSITWSNYCPDAFNLDLWGWPSDDPLCRAISLPSSPLDPNAGIEVLAWEQHLIDVSEDAGSGYAVWKHPNGHWFGVAICVPEQVSHIGDSPYYQVCWSQVGHSDWFNPVSDPGQSYNFPSDWEAMAGFKIRIDASAGGTSLLLRATVST